MNNMKRFICWLLGHWVEEISIGLGQARCGRCNDIFKVHYDGTYGETVFDKKLTEFDAVAFLGTHTPHFLYPCNAGTDAHIAQIVAHDLREKGVVLGDSIEDMKRKGVMFEQEFINDKPQHLIWYDNKRVH